MKHSASILIVEDEEAIRVGLTDVLIYHGYHVDVADNGKVGLMMAQTGKYDLLLLDVMLPEVNGFDICQRIRKRDKSQAIIMLTAKSTDEDIINGLQLGADDYIAKPFSITQLVLRIKAVLKRTMMETATEPFIVLDDNTKIDVHNYCLETQSGTVSFTKREIQLLEYLHRHQHQTLSREALLYEVWGYKKELEIETRTVDIHIARLRRKIEQDHKSPKFLLTVRGAGYRLLSRQQA